MPLNPPELEWLKQCVSQVSPVLAKHLPDSLWRKPDRIVDTLRPTTNSDGFVALLGPLRGDPGSELQIWIDRWSDGKTLRVAYGYRSIHPERVKAFKVSEFDGKKTVGGKRSPVPVWPNATLARMQPVLNERECGHPLLEVYSEEKAWSFVSAYEWKSPVLGKAPAAALVARIVEFLEWVARAAVGRPEKAYANENKRQVVEHLRRERNARLARAAKVRDHFRCQVCDQVLEDMYGPLAEGIADAHHIVPLAQHKKEKVTRLEDLITVCPNCHRVLHQMAGNAGDWKALRKEYRALERRPRRSSTKRHRA